MHLIIKTMQVQMLDILNYLIELGRLNTKSLTMSFVSFCSSLPFFTKCFGVNWKSVKETWTLHFRHTELLCRKSVFKNFLEGNFQIKTIIKCYFVLFFLSQRKCKLKLTKPNTLITRALYSLSWLRVVVA